MKNWTLTVGLVFLMAFTAFAQVTNPDYSEYDDEPQQERRERERNPDKPTFMERTYFGGNFGLSFGDIVFVDVSPLMGYMVTEQFSLGAGFTYRYLSNRIFVPSVDFNVVGGRIFARYDITPVIYPYAEYETLSFKFGGSEAPRQWGDAIFLGVGFFQPIGQRGGGVNILTLYMVNWSVGNLLYASPWQFRVGFQI